MSCCCAQKGQKPGSCSKPAEPTPIWKIAVALILAGQSMMLGIGLNMTPPQFDTPTYWWLHGALLGIVLVSFCLLGVPLMRASWEAMKARRLSLEGLFLLSMVGALVGSLLSTFTGEGEVYYEVVSVVLIIFTVGKILSARSRQKAQEESQKMRREFDFATIRGESGELKSVPQAELSCCATVLVRPGDAVTVDGIVLEGQGFIKDTTMTGELEPSSKSPGEAVLAGSYSVDATFVIKPTATGADRQLHALLDTIENATLTPSNLQAQADRIIQWFLPLVATVAIGTFIYWFGQAPWNKALFNSMAVLLVACPCALGLATPLAIWTGLWRLSTLGIISKQGTFIDSLAGAQHVIFDKTGTLSADKLSLLAFEPTEAFSRQLSYLQAITYTLEAQINHPIARALLCLKDHGYAGPVELEDTKIVPGEGIQGVLKGGTAVFLGTHEGAEAHPEAKKVIELRIGTELAALIYLEETLRENTLETLKVLQDKGIQVHILSGDPNPPEKSIAGLDLQYDLTPAQKEAFVQNLRDQGHSTLYVGDGLNDAPAMSLASASIAMGSATSLTQSAASATFLGQSLENIVKALTLARRIRSSIRGNMLYAAAYNVAGMSLAAIGKLHPVAAALVMLLSSLTVSYRAMRASSKPIVN